MSRVRGFTLIEVIVAMTIMAVSFSVLFSLSSRSLDGMRRARDIERRIEFARAKLAELHLLEDLQPGDHASGAFDEKANWSVDVLPFIRPVADGPHRNPNAVVRIQLSLQWQGAHEPQRWQVDSYRQMTSAAVNHIPLEEKLRAIEAK
jgi:prepilin-type N-terminal cleavage/methylation domain-containing protein